VSGTRRNSQKSVDSRRNPTHKFSPFNPLALRSAELRKAPKSSAEVHTAHPADFIYVGASTTSDFTRSQSSRKSPRLRGESPRLSGGSRLKKGMTPSNDIVAGWLAYRTDTRSDSINLTRETLTFIIRTTIEQQANIEARFKQSTAVQNIIGLLRLYTTLI